MIVEQLNVSNLIFEGIKEAQQGKIEYLQLFYNENCKKGKNEFLFFIKPEITISSDSINLESILSMILDKISNMGLVIKNINILSAKYLQQHNIIAQHYGVINQISTNAVSNLSETAISKFEDIYGKKIEACNVLGGVEFLEKYPTFNALSLDFLWQNKENKKLSGGTYCEDIKLDGEIVHLINGFHPRQLLHFTEQGRSIVVFTLVGDLDWSEARNKLIGATNPIKAEEGSIRKTLLDNKEVFGLSEVSQGMNGVHLSAGPVEGLIELVRYNSNFTQQDKIKSIESFAFGNLLLEKFEAEKVNYILSNPNIIIDGKSISIFDFTEEKNSAEAIEMISQIFK